MNQVIYEVVEHNGGWAYRVGNVYSETFDTRKEAVDAANRAAAEHELAGPNEHIEYEDAGGAWHEEDVSGQDRPETSVDVPPASRD